MNRVLNNFKTALFLGLLFGLALAVGDVLGGQQGLIIAFIFGGMTSVGAYFFSDKIAIASAGGVEADPREHADLIEMVGRLAKNGGLPMPKVYVTPQEAPNAFATGRSPSHAAVAVTQGALQVLSYDELEGVIGHELSHVKNRDTLTSTVAATIAGAIVFMAHWGWMLGGGRRDSRNDGGASILFLLLSIILAPLAAALIQMAISRSREFVADADGARLAGSPNGLISALRKLEAYSQRIPMTGVMPSQAQMFIVEPLLNMSMANLFASHPPTEERIARLQELA